MTVEQLQKTYKSGNDLLEKNQLAVNDTTKVYLRKHLLKRFKLHLNDIWGRQRPAKSNDNNEGEDEEEDEKEEKAKVQYAPMPEDLVPPPPPVAKKALDYVDPVRLRLRNEPYTTVLPGGLSVTIQPTEKNAVNGLQRIIDSMAMFHQLCLYQSKIEIYHNQLQKRLEQDEPKLKQRIQELEQQLKASKDQLQKQEHANHLLSAEIQACRRQLDNCQHQSAILRAELAAHRDQSQKIAGLFRFAPPSTS